MQFEHLKKDFSNEYEPKWRRFKGIRCSKLPVLLLYETWFDKNQFDLQCCLPPVNDHFGSLQHRNGGDVKGFYVQ